jgi:hypothetical protein
VLQKLLRLNQLLVHKYAASFTIALLLGFGNRSLVLQFLDIKDGRFICA